MLLRHCGHIVHNFQSNSLQIVTFIFAHTTEFTWGQFSLLFAAILCSACFQSKILRTGVFSETDFNHKGLRLLISTLALCLPTEGQASNFFYSFLNTSAAVVEQIIVLLSLTQLLPRTDRACSSCSRTLTGLVSQDTTCRFFILKEFLLNLAPFQRSPKMCLINISNYI